MSDEEGPREAAESPDGRAGGGTNAPLSRSEVVRRALAAGFEAAADAVPYIRQQFGIEISPSLFLAAKATERKNGWARNGKPGRKPKQSAGKDDEADGPVEQQAGEDDGS